MGNTRTFSPLRILAVEHIEQFRALTLHIPLAKIVADGKEPLFRTCLFLVTRRTADTSVKLILFNSFQYECVCSVLRLAYFPVCS